MPVARSPDLSPITEEQNSIPSPLVPTAWKCCNCNILNFIFDHNQAWYTHTPEYCTSLSCLHERCATCFDPGPILWPIQYAENRPIPHLFQELEDSFSRQEEEATATLIAVGEGSFLNDGTHFNTANDNNVDTDPPHSDGSESIISDEDHWLEILGHPNPPQHPSRPPPLAPQLSELHNNNNVAALVIGDGAVSYPCPLRTTRFCEERFASEALAWRHSAVHTGQERVKCARKGCPMVFLGKEPMRLHFLGRHC